MHLVAEGPREGKTGVCQRWLTLFMVFGLQVFACLSLELVPDSFACMFKLSFLCTGLMRAALGEPLQMRWF